MINITNNNIVDIGVGNTSIEKAYISSQLVWQKSVPTIEDTNGVLYYIKNYVQTNSGAYINTGYNSGSDIQYKFKVKTPSSFKTVCHFCGARRSGYSTSYAVFVYTNNTLRFAYYSVKKNIMSITTNTDYEFYANKNKLYVNDVLKTTMTDTSSYSKKFFVGMCNGYDTANNFRIYYFQFWKNDALVRDYIPVQRVNDGVWGLFDKVTNTFFASANSSVAFSGS